MADNNEYRQNFNQILYEYFNKIKMLRRAQTKIHYQYESPNINADCENLIDEAINIIDNVMTKEVNATTIRLISMKTTLLFEYAKIMSANENEEISIYILLLCLNNVKLHLTDPSVIYLATKIINHYAYLHIKHRQYEDALVPLELAERIYKQYCCGESQLHFTSEDLFSPFLVTPSNKTHKLENIATNNYEMLAYVYNKLKMHNKFLCCHHNVLDRHYKMPNNDHLIWSAKVANLAVYFSRNNRFEEARHYLSAAVHVLYDYEKLLTASENTRTCDDRWQELHKTFADVATGWVKYGLNIFTASKKRIRERIRDNSNELSRDSTRLSKNLVANSTMRNKIEPSTLNHNAGEKLFFKSLDVSYIESHVPATLITRTIEARILFHHTHVWLKKLKVTLSLQEQPMQYMNAILDLSELYKSLAFYEENLETEYALAKLRVDAVETLNQIFYEIRPQCWIIAQPLIYHELTAIQLELMGLNMRRLYAKCETRLDVNQKKFYDIMETISDLHSKLYSFSADHSPAKS